MVDLYKRSLVSKGLLGGMGIATLAAISTTKVYSATADEDTSSSTADFIHYLQSNENLKTILAGGSKVIILDPDQVYNWSGVAIKNIERVRIVGNQAVVNSGKKNAPALTINNSSNIVIEDVIFKGSNTGSIYKSTASKNDNGIVIYQSNSITVKGCSFTNFTGAGINMYNYKGSKLFIQNIITGNRFTS